MSRVSSQPWLDDPIVGAAAPWESDPIVEPTRERMPTTDHPEPGDEIPEPGSGIEPPSDLARAAFQTDPGFRFQTPAPKAQPIPDSRSITEQASDAKGLNAMEREFLAIGQAAGQGWDAAKKRFREIAAGPDAFGATWDEPDAGQRASADTQAGAMEQVGPVGGFAAGMTGGLTGVADPAQAATLALGGVAGKAVGAMAGKGMAALAPQLTKAIGPAAAQIVTKAITGGSHGLGFGATAAGINEASVITPEEWAADPVAALTRVGKAMGSEGALWGAIGAVTGGGSAIRPLIAERRAALGRTAMSDVHGAVGRGRAEGPTMAPEASEASSTRRPTEADWTLPDEAKAPAKAPEPVPTPTEAPTPAPWQADPIIEPASKQTLTKEPTREEVPAQVEGTPVRSEGEAQAQGAVQRGVEEAVTPVPEKPATTAAQMDMLREGNRRAVLFTPGEAVAEKGEFAKLKTDAGTFIYDPARIKPTEIKAAVAEGRIGDVLDYGIAAKPAEPIGTVVVRSPEGVEKQAVVTDQASLPAVTAAAEKVAGPGDTVGLEHPGKVVGERLGGGNEQAPVVGSGMAETRYLNRQFGDLPAGTPIKLTGKRAGYEGSEVEAVMPNGTTRGLPESWLRSTVGKPKIGTLKALIEKHGRDSVDRMVNDWDGAASLSPDGNSIVAVTDPRNQAGKSRGSVREFLAWAADRDQKPPAPVEAKQPPPLTMKLSALRAELTAGGVEFDPKASKRELASGVEQLRGMGKGEAPAKTAEAAPKKFTADDWMKQDKAVREKRGEDAAFVGKLPDREYVSPQRTDAAGDTKVVEFSKPRDFRLPNTDHTKKVDPAAHGAEVVRLMEQGQKPSDYVATATPGHSVRGKNGREGIGNLKAFMREVPEFNLDPTFTVVADGATTTIASVDAKGKRTYAEGPPGLRLKFKDGGTYIWEPDAIGIVLPEGVKAGEKIRIDPEAVRKMEVDDGWLVSAPGSRAADLSQTSTYGDVKKPRPRKGENIIIPKVVEEAAGLATRGAHGAKNIAEGVVAGLRRLSDTAAGYMERLGTAGKKLAGEVRDIDRTAHKESATDRLALRDVLAGMDRSARETVAKAINGRIGDLHQPASLRAKAEQVRVILDRAMKAANAAGLKRTVAGHEVDIKGSGKAFPQVPNDAGRIVLEEAETRGLSSPRVQRTIEKMHRARRERAGLDPDTPPTPDETNHILASLKKLRDQQKRGVNPYFERTRIELPEDLVEWDPARVLPHLLDRNWMLVQAVEKWGPDFKNRDAGLQTIAYEHGQHHATTIDNYLKASFGLTGQVDPAIDKAIRAASNYESLSKMGFSPLSVFRNVGGRFSNLFAYDPAIQAKALKDLPPFVGGLFRESRKIGESMEKTGAVRATSTLADIEVGAPGHGITNKALGLFKVAERGNQVHTSYVAGLQLAADIDRLAKAQPRGPLGKIMESLVSLTGLRDTDAGVARRVERAGIDGDQLADIMADPKHRLTPEQMERAAYLAVNDTQFALSLATSPVWWANSPVLRLMAKFKPWGVRQVQLIYNQVAKEGLKGNFAPLARFMVAITVAGELYYEARDLIVGSDKSIASAALGGEDDTKEYAWRVLRSFLAGGGLGFISDLTYGVSAWAGGPAVNTAKSGMEAIASIAQRPTLLQSQAAVRKFLRDEFAVSRQALPIIDRIDKWAFNEGNMAAEYGRLRSKGFAFKEGKTAGVGSMIKDAIVGREFGVGKNSIPYDYAARNITVNDVDDAAEYLASVLEDAPDRKAAIQGIRASLRSHSPLGPVAEKDRSAFLQSLTNEERQKALALNVEWTQRANRALTQAMQKAAASARSKSGGGSQ